MTELIFPKEKTVRAFIEFIKSMEADFLQQHLPSCDEEWYKIVTDCYEQIQLPYFNGNVVNVTSYIFYKLCKNHRLADGNKRTAVIATFLFLYENDYITMFSSDTMARLARVIAESNPRESEKHIEHLKFTFSWAIDMFDSGD